MGRIDDILESKMRAAEKSDNDEGCLLLNALRAGALVCNKSIWESQYFDC
jgi:hypothetical protein